VFHILDKIKGIFSKKQQDKQAAAAAAAAQQRQVPLAGTSARSTSSKTQQKQQAPPPVMGQATRVCMGCHRLSDLDRLYFVGWAHSGFSAPPQQASGLSGGVTVGPTYKEVDSSIEGPSPKR
jgi:hypothetical protein